MLANLPPIYGLYGCITPVFMYGLFGTSSHVHIGPFALVSMMVSSTLSFINADTNQEDYLYAVSTLSLICGILFVILGVCRCGVVTRLLSETIVTAFTTASAFNIGGSQLKHYWGVSCDADVFLEIIRTLFFTETRNAFNWWAFLLGGSATVTVQDGDRLLITSATTGADSSVSYAANPDGEPEEAPQPTTDLAGSLGLTEATGAVSTAGTAQVQPPAGALVSVSGSSLVITSPSTGAGSSVSYASDPAPSGEIPDLAGALGLTEAAGAASVAGTAAYQPVAPVVTYSSQTRAFQITSGETGTASSVGFAQGTGGTDLSALLNLTEQLGAVQSEGTDGGSLTDCMSNVLKYARDWVSFSTIWEPVYAEKIELARWCSGNDTRFVHVMWDTDNAARVPGSTASAGYAITHTLELDGTCCVWNTLDVAAGVMGAIACLNFDQREGRTTLAYRQFEGVAVTCDDDEDYVALTENGYNCYADFATASAQFKFFQNGQVSGTFSWLDTYCNAIALKDALQLNILDLFAAVRSLPYNEDGYSSVRTACLDTINRFVNFGAIRVGIALSQTQKVQLLQEIGKDVSQTLESAGWYMQVEDPGAVIRGQRQSPNCAFYYMDGGSIQKIVMSATAIL